ncbi:MAG TPA: alpha/beta hydrolase [Beijerinckiaceae bacterium]|nr:alpha/beta hydrolase [Beijerinckiaceae bacterium]
MNRRVAAWLGASLVAALGLGGLKPARAQDALPPGPGMFAMRLEQVGANDDPMRVFVYRPARWTRDDRIVIVMHGRERDADRYRDEWQPHAEEHNLLLVVPEFSNAKFPGAGTYNFGNVSDRKARPLPRAAWTFGVIDKVFAEAKARSGARRDRYSFFGHSAGAQFVHRYLLFAGASSADLIIAANAGAYTMPTQEVDFPWGLKGVGVTRADLAGAFARNVVILLGGRDTDPNHATLPRNPGAVAQGPHRLARGEKFFATGKATAEALGAPFRWRLEIVPGVAHSNKGMSARAAAIIAAGGS